MRSWFASIGEWLRKLWQRARKVNPFVLLAVLFLIGILLPGEYSLWNQIKYSREIDRQKAEIKELKQEIKVTQEALEELKYTKDKLEQFARERYLMKEEGEDLYLIK